jgi:hypothetical protein
MVTVQMDNSRRKDEKFQGIEVKWIQLERQKERARRIGEPGQQEQCKLRKFEQRYDWKQHHVLQGAKNRVGAMPRNAVRISRLKDLSDENIDQPGMSSGWSNTSQAMTHWTGWGTSDVKSWSLTVSSSSVAIIDTTKAKSSMVRELEIKEESRGWGRRRISAKVQDPKGMLVGYPLAEPFIHP